MAVPVTVTGLSTAIPCVGPFRSSAGNFYSFARDGTTATTIQCYKATDPTSSWSSISTKTGFATSVQALTGVQNGDIIHLAIIDGATTSCNLKYQTFDMSSDTFVTAETVQSGFNPISSASIAQYACSIVYRTSDSQPVILYSGARATVMGSNYSRIVYARRTGTNAWTSNVGVDAGGQVDFTIAEAIQGSSSTIHFFWGDLSATGTFTRTLDSSNNLQSSPPAKNTTVGRPRQSVSYNSSGTQKIALITDNNRVLYFNGSTAPTLNSSGVISTNSQDPRRLFVDSVTLYAVYGKSTDSDLYLMMSTNHGATWS